MNKPKDYFLRFIKKERLGKHAFSFYFARPKKGLNFSAGQYMNMYLPHENPDRKGTCRFFTIASSPHETEHIMITTTDKSKSSFKKTLKNLTPNQQVRFYGPTGKLVLEKNNTQPLVFLAGGVGITPFYSMLTTLVEKKKITFPITLIVSFSNKEDVLFQEELMNVSKMHKTIQIVYTLTTPGSNSSDWKGDTGKISKKLIQKYVSDVKIVQYYVVGLPEMVEDTRQLLLSMGIAEGKIFTENYTGY